LYFIGLFVLILVGSGLIYSYGGTSPSVVGHSGGEIDFNTVADGAIPIRTLSGQIPFSMISGQISSTQISFSADSIPLSAIPSIPYTEITGRIRVFSLPAGCSVGGVAFTSASSYSCSTSVCATYPAEGGGSYSYFYTCARSCSSSSAQQCAATFVGYLV